MNIKFGRNLGTCALAASILAFGGSAFADVVTRTSGDMLTEFGRASPSRHEGVANGVRALKPNVAEVGRGGFERVGQSPGTIVGTSKVSGEYVKGGSATLQDIPFGRR